METRASHGGPGRTTLFGCAIAALAAGVIATLLWVSADSSQPRAFSAEPQVLIASIAPLGEFAQNPVLAGARPIGRAELIETTPSEAALVVIDADVARTLGPGDLRAWASAGSAVIGLNVPLDELNALTGFEAELNELNPRFTDAPRPPGAREHEGAFYSLVWRTPPGANPAQWGRLEHDRSDGLFDAVISQHVLLVQGLISDGGEVIPLEDYGADPER